MDTIQIICDNTYTKKAIAELILNVRSNGCLSKKVAVFIFEKKWLGEQELHELMSCDANDLLIFARPELYDFIKLMRWTKNIAFGDCSASMEEITFSLQQFLSPVTHSFVCRSRKNRCSMMLTNTEQKMMELVLQGISVGSISKILNREYKTISLHKRNAMKKLGTASDAGLIHRGRMYLMMKV
ncbi:helix-turn-helix domain-containing protein [Dryocola clanedunensis]